MKKFDEILEEKLYEESVLSKVKDLISGKVSVSKIVGTFDLRKPANMKKFVKATRSLNDPKFRVVLNQVMMAAGA